jgi:phage gpG-like protein
VAKITGGDKFKRRLQRMRSPRMVRSVTRAIYGVADDIKVAAQISISAGSISGKNHVPSAPGTPPNNDSGVLAGNIEAVSTGPLKAEVSSNAPYAAAQEFGSQKQNLPERPYMRPATAQERPGAIAKVAAAVDKVVRG